MADQQADDLPVTLEQIRAAADETWKRIEPVLAQLGAVLSAGPDAGGWTPRQLLSHLIGAWQRVPIHTGFFLANALEVPIQLNNDYWIAEWETAPLEAFALAMKAAYEANKAFLTELDPAFLTRTAHTPFGEAALSDLLLTSYRGHIANFHLPQLQAFLTR